MLSVVNNGLVTAYSKRSIAGKDRMTGAPIIRRKPLVTANGQSEMEIQRTISDAIASFYNKYKSKLIITQTVTVKQKLIQSILSNSEDQLAIITYRREQLIAMSANCNLLLTVIDDVLNNPTIIGLEALDNLYSTILSYQIPTDITEMYAAIVQMQQNYPKPSEICTDTDIATVNLINSHLIAVETLLKDNTAIIIDYYMRELLTKVENDIIEATSIQLKSESGDPISPEELLIYKNLVVSLTQYDLTIATMFRSYGVDFYKAELTETVLGDHVLEYYGSNNRVFYSVTLYLARCKKLLEYCNDLGSTIDLTILNSTILLLSNYLLICSKVLQGESLSIDEVGYAGNYTIALSNLDSIRTISCKVGFSFADGVFLKESVIPDTQDTAIVSNSLTLKYLGTNYVQKLKFASGVFKFYDDLYTLSKDWNSKLGAYVVNAAYLPPIAQDSVESYVQEWTNGNQQLFESDAEAAHRKGYEQIIWQITNDVLCDENAIQELLKYPGYCDGSGNSLTVYQAIRSGIQKICAWTGVAGAGYGPSPALGNLPTGYVLTKTIDLARQQNEFNSTIPRILRLSSMLKKTQIAMSNYGISLSSASLILWNNYVISLQDIASLANMVQSGIWLNSTDEADFLQLLTVFNTSYAALKTELSSNYSFNLDTGRIIPYGNAVQDTVGLEDGIFGDIFFGEGDLQ